MHLYLIFWYTTLTYTQNYIFYRTRSIWFRPVHLYRFFGERRDFVVGVAERGRISGISAPSSSWSGHVSRCAFRADHRERDQKLGDGHVATAHASFGRVSHHRVHARVLQLRLANRMGSGRTSYIHQHYDRKFLILFYLIIIWIILTSVRERIIKIMIVIFFIYNIYIY